MTAPPGVRAYDFAALVLIFLAALGPRAWYLHEHARDGHAPGPIQVQGENAEQLEQFIQSWHEERLFACVAPLSDASESTAHCAPVYPWLVAQAAGITDEYGFPLRWFQVALGTLTACLYFFFARLAFGSTLTGLVAGIFCALHPFWIINNGEIADGTLVSFLLALALVLGTYALQTHGVGTALLFGLALAGLAMTRATLLPFALAAFLTFVWQCRAHRRGWFVALLALLGFANGLAPWVVHNQRTFGVPLPIVDSTYLHLWIGNHPQASGGPLGEAELRATLPSDRLKALLAEKNQAVRYAMLADEVVDAASADPTKALTRRVHATQAFVLGGDWPRGHKLARLARLAPPEQAPAEQAQADWLVDQAELLLHVALLLMLALAFLGWRWSAAYPATWLAAMAVLWVPLPYLLTHGEALSGPRLPLDGVLLCFAACTVASGWAGASARPEAP